MIRDRIGKHCPEELQQARKLESEISAHRKRWTCLSEHQLRECECLEILKGCASLFSQIDPKTRNALRADSLEGAKIFIEKRLENTKKLEKLVITKPNGDTIRGGQFTERLFTLLTEFAANTKFIGLEEYLKNKHSVDGLDCSSLFFSKMKIKLEDEYCKQRNDTDRSKEPQLREAFSKMDLPHKRAVVDNLLFTIAYEGYGLQRSAFNPIDGVLSLRQALQTRGPMYCKGYFALACYVAPAEKMGEIEGTSLWGWKKTAAKVPVSTTVHSIVVVGAKSEAQEPSQGTSKALVYFVDPYDGSDPLNPTKQKLYVMSFEGFKSKIASLRNEIIPSAEHKDLFFEDNRSVGFGLHGPIMHSASASAETAVL
jgi:hypothetical protein